MYQQEQREVILQLKTIKIELDLTNQDIQEMVENAGYSTSHSSIYRLFAEGSENRTFNYRTTIQPVFKVLTEVAKSRKVTDIDETILQAQFDALKAESLLKDEIIKTLSNDLEVEKRKVAHLLKQVEQQSKMLDKLLG